MCQKIAKNKYLLDTNRAVYYVNEILNAQEDIEERAIYSEARKEMLKLKEESESKINFWNWFNDNPEQAISLLSNSIKNNEELTPYTKVRRK